MGLSGGLQAITVIYNLYRLFALLLPAGSMNTCLPARRIFVTFRALPPHASTRIQNNNICTALRIMHDLFSV